VKPWLDTASIRPGEDWPTAIARALDTCDGILLIASQYSMTSAPVRHEWLTALERRAPIWVWQVDDCTIDPLLSQCRHVDLRADPLDSDGSNTAAAAMAGSEPPLESSGAARRRPAYVDHYVRRHLLLVIAVWVLGVSGFFALSLAGWHQSLSSSADYTRIDPRLVFALPVVATETAWHVSRMRKRRAQWRELHFFLRQTALWLGIGLPVQYGVAIALDAFVAPRAGMVWLVVSLAAGCVWVLTDRKRASNSMFRWVLGSYPHRYRSMMIQSGLARDTVTRGEVRAFLFNSRLPGWCPAFIPNAHSSTPTADWARAHDRPGADRPLPTNDVVYLVFDPVDVRFAERVWTRLNTPRLVRLPLETSPESDDWIARVTPDRYVIFVLTRYSQEALLRFISRRECRLDAVVLVQLEAAVTAPDELRLLQVLDATTLDFDNLAAGVAGLLDEEERQFRGVRDHRTDPLRLPPEVLRLASTAVVIATVLSWICSNVLEERTTWHFPAGIGLGLCAGVSWMFARRLASLAAVAATILGLSGVTVCCALASRTTDVRSWLLPMLTALLAYLVLRGRSIQGVGDAVHAWSPERTAVDRAVWLAVALLWVSTAAFLFR
jgi:hypothetical protein